VVVFFGAGETQESFCDFPVIGMFAQCTFMFFMFLLLLDIDKPFCLFVSLSDYALQRALNISYRIVKIRTVSRPSQ